MKTRTYHKKYKVTKVFNAKAFWRLMELRKTREGVRYVCIAIGGPALKTVVKRLYRA